MTLLRLDIVGLWFKPPASSIVKLLPHNCALEVAAEPNNLVDPNAIAVWLPIAPLNLNPVSDVEETRTTSVLSRDLFFAFAGGWLSKAVEEDKLIQAETYDEFMSLAAFQLGYIPAAIASGLAISSTLSGKLKWRDPEKARQQPKAQVEFDYGQ